MPLLHARRVTPRRLASRRLAVVATATMAGAALLSACSTSSADPNPAPSASGTTASPTQSAQARKATSTYQRYVKAEAAALVTGTEQFVAAVKAGDTSRAKALYPTARSHFERIEPVAASFGDLDPRIDGREDGLEEGETFGGYHRLEKDLWRTGLTAESSRVADQLLADVELLAKEAQGATFQPIDLANGSKALLDEMASGKVTGEEERYSHTDLYDFAANLDGCATALAALAPMITASDPTLAATIADREKALEKVLAQHRTGRDGWQSYTALTDRDVKELSAALDAYSEAAAQAAAAVA